MPEIDRFHPGPQAWPGIMYPWLPSPWIPHEAVIIPERYCLGNSCWNLRRLQFFEACGIERTLYERSWPLQTAALMAGALYRAGHDLQARGICRAYGGRYGVDRFNAQVARVYGGAYIPAASVLAGPPSGAPTWAARDGIGSVRTGLG